MDRKLAGAVAIPAEPLTRVCMAVIVIGGFSVAIFIAITSHRLAGINRDLSVLFGDVSVPSLSKLVGAIAAGVFVSIPGLLVWFADKLHLDVRPSAEEHGDGLNLGKARTIACPEFASDV